MYFLELSNLKQTLLFWIEQLTTIHCPIAQLPTLTADLDSMITWTR